MPASVFLALVILYSFATLSLFQLAALQFRQSRLGRPVWGGWAWRILIVNFGITFALLSWDYLRYIFADGRPGPFSLANRALFVFVSAITPALLAHSFYVTEGRNFPAPRLWRALVIALYIVDVAGAAVSIWGLANGHAPRGVFQNRVWTVLDWSLALALMFLVATVWIKRPGEDVFRRRLRLWFSFLVFLVLAHFIVKIFWWPPWAERGLKLVPLAFVFLTTYYAERLNCVDVFIKRGAFFFLSVPTATLWLAFLLPHVSLTRMRFASAWTAALGILPLIAAAPWVYSRLSAWLDRVLFGRRFSSREAADYFLDTVRGAATESEFLRRAGRALSAIFQSEVRIDGDGPAPGDALSADAGDLTIHVAPRQQQAPFLSEDSALLDAMAERATFLLENLRGQQRERQLVLDAAESQLKALRAQVNPHFLFNALSAIAGLIAQAPERAEQTVEQLAEVFRYTLRRSDREWVRLAEEFEFVRAYLDVEQARFGHRLHTHVEADPGVAAVRIPAMVVGTLAENAIKHGVAAVRGPGHVSVTARLRQDRVVIEVEDNGPGFPRSFTMDDLPASQSGGYGLRNVRDRIAAHFGGRGAIRFERRAAATVVSLEIPAMMEEAKTV